MPTGLFWIREAGLITEPTTGQINITSSFGGIRSED